MSAEVRMREIIEDAVRRATEPLEKAVDALHARLAALETSGGPSDAEPVRRPARGRGARAKAQSDGSSPAGDPAEPDLSGEKRADAVPAQREGNGE